MSSRLLMEIVMYFSLTSSTFNVFIGLVVFVRFFVLAVSLVGRLATCKLPSRHHPGRGPLSLYPNITTKCLEKQEILWYYSVGSNLTMKEVLMSIDVGERIREIRTRRGLSQQELAQKAKLAPDTVLNAEKRKHASQPRTLRKLAAALDVEVSDLFEEVGDPLAEAPLVQICG
jgi:DNA-binding XRE family transcriptional regulator